MDDDPAASVRKKKDSSLVRAAELVRDGRACAMVSAGNTGATMASALLRMGRLPGVVRPCIATPIPNPGHTPMVLVDAGANSECTPEMLVQFALMASTFVTAHYGVERPARRPALDRRGVDQGHAAGEGDPPTPGRARRTQLRRQRRGPRPRALAGRRRRHRRLHRQRGAQDPRGRAQVHLRDRARRVDTNDETRAAGDVLFEYLLPLARRADARRTRAARCCSASTASA